MRLTLYDAGLSHDQSFGVLRYLKDQRSFVHVFVTQPSTQTSNDLASQIIRAWVAREEASSDDEVEVEESLAIARRELMAWLDIALPLHLSVDAHDHFHLGCYLGPNETGELELKKLWNMLETDALPLLKHVSDLRYPIGPGSPPLIPTSDLLVQYNLDSSSGSAHKVTWNGAPHVLKALDPSQVLAYGLTADRTSPMSDALYRELEILLHLPAHPNITYISAVVIAGSDTDPVVLGFLQPYFEGGPPADATPSLFTPLQHRALLAKSITSGLKHLHTAGKTFHGDIKLGNVVLAALHSPAGVLIILEQSRTSEHGQAPETCGDFDAEMDSGGNLVYQPYVGLQDRVCDAPGDYGQWSALDEWAASAPEAVERAEVFALGRLLAEVFELGDADKPEVPAEWRELVVGCVREDPLARPRLSEVETFFVRELERRQ